MPSRLGLVVLVLAGALQAASPALAGWPAGPEIGSCALCCSVYPSGWRGMCVRRCASERRWLPVWQRRYAPCDCRLNWRREWACWGR
jgi:hypothetical protein